MKKLGDDFIFNEAGKLDTPLEQLRYLIEFPYKDLPTDFEIKARLEKCLRQIYIVLAAMEEPDARP